MAIKKTKTEEPQTKVDLLKLREKDKGDTLARLDAQIEEADTKLNKRLEDREELEADIATKKQTEMDLDISIATKEAREAELTQSVAGKEAELETKRAEERTLARSCTDLEDKRAERNTLAESVQTLTGEEQELKQAVSIATTNLRRLAADSAVYEEREAAIKTGAVKNLEDVAANKAESERLERDGKQLAKDRAVVDDGLQHIRLLDGKSIGHYIRGFQRFLDEQGIKARALDIFQSL